MSDTKTLAERLRWVVDQKLVKSARIWAVDAGLNPGFLYKFLDRVDKDVAPDMGIQTLTRLAQIAGIREAWLSLGDGEPFPTSRPALEDLPPVLRAAVARFPERWRALTIERAAMRQRRIGEDLTEEQWIEHLDVLEREERRLELERVAAQVEPPAGLRAAIAQFPQRWRALTIERAAMRRRYEGEDLTEAQWIEHLDGLEREERRLELERIARKFDRRAAARP